MHPNNFPNKKILVIFISTGILTNTLPNAVIWPDGFLSSPIDKAPVSYKFLIAIPISLMSGGWIALPKISSGSYRFQIFIWSISFSSGHLYISGFGYLRILS